MIIVEEAANINQAVNQVGEATGFSLEHFGRGLIGLAFVIIVAWLFSRRRKDINWRLVGIGMGLHIAIALVLRLDLVAKGMKAVSTAFVDVSEQAIVGAKFVFGGVLTDPGGSAGFVFAFRVLPIIIFFAAITSALYYLGVLQFIVRLFAWVMAKTMRLSGSESISVAGNVFLGQTEAPLLVKPYVEGMTKSELFTLMVGGMATIAGSVLATYVSFLGGDSDAEKAAFASHLITASLMNAPAAIVMAKIIVPEKRGHLIDTELKVSQEKIGSNLLDAIANGTSEGMKLAANVAAMLIAFIAIIALVNLGLGKIGEIGDLNETIRQSTLIPGTDSSVFTQLNLEYLIGQLFRFVAWTIGIEWADSVSIGSLLGIKMIANEFLAYAQLKDMANAAAITARSKMLAAYALCGFANFSSIAIQIGGIGQLAPGKRVQISELGLLSVVAGTLASLMTAAVAGMLH